MKATEPQVAQITLFNLSFITEPIHCPNLRQLCNGLDVGYLWFISPLCWLLQKLKDVEILREWCPLQPH